MSRMPAECWPLSVFIREEMEARGWTDADLYARLGDDPVMLCAVDLTLTVDDPGLILDENTAAALGQAFDVDPSYFLNLDKAWRDWCAERALEDKN